MPFKRILSDLIAVVPGANGAILADWEGEAVDQIAIGDEFEIKLIGAHKGIILNRIRAAHADLDAGELWETVISASDRRFVLGPVGPEYALVLALGKNSIVGQAVYRFREAVALLKKEIL